MKEYRVYEDKYTSSYIAMMKKQGTYEKYIKKVVFKPGGIRPAKKGSEPHRADSMYSDKGSRKSKFSIIIYDTAGKSR
jgi:hypothetical protein